MAPSFSFFSRFPFPRRHEPIRSPPPSIPTESMAIPTRIRCLLILLFSPLILPLLFLTFPLVFALGLCLWIRFCCRRRNRRRRRRRLVGKKKSAHKEEEESAAAELRRCEEGLKEIEDEKDEEEDGEIGRLLQVYLEDQLRLAKSIVSGDKTESSVAVGVGVGGGGIRIRRDDVDSKTVPLLT
ncbi:hypothetical protein LINGRAHAP2_LOCUS36291 [Linum grandiflorum]